MILISSVHPAHSSLSCSVMRETQRPHGSSLCAGSGKCISGFIMSFHAGSALLRFIKSAEVTGHDTNRRTFSHDVSISGSLAWPASGGCGNNLLRSRLLTDLRRPPSTLRSDIPLRLVDVFRGSFNPSNREDRGGWFVSSANPVEIVRDGLFVQNWCYFRLLPGTPWDRRSDVQSCPQTAASPTLTHG